MGLGKTLGDFLGSGGLGLGDLPGGSLLFPSSAEEDLQRQLAAGGQRAQAAAAAINAARPMNLAAALQAFGPANQMLGHMYGPQFMIDMAQIPGAVTLPGMPGAPAQQQLSDAIGAGNASVFGIATPEGRGALEQQYAGAPRAPQGTGGGPLDFLLPF